MTLLRLPGGVEAAIRVRGEETGDAFTMLTDSAPPGWRLPPHAHRRESETIHITSGAFFEALAGVDDPAQIVELARTHGWEFGP